MIDPRPLWDFDDPAASGDRFLDVAEHADEPDRTAWLTQHARALGLQERYDDAHKVLDQLTSDDPQTATYLDLERGRVLNSSGRPEQARPLFESAARTAAAGGLDALHVDALHMVAIAAPPRSSTSSTDVPSRWRVRRPTSVPATGTRRSSTTSG